MAEWADPLVAAVDALRIGLGALDDAALEAAVLRLAAVRVSVDQAWLEAAQAVEARALHRRHGEHDAASWLARCRRRASGRDPSRRRSRAVLGDAPAVAEAARAHALSIVLAPDAAPGALGWVGLVAAAVALVCARRPRGRRVVRQRRVLRRRATHAHPTTGAAAARSDRAGVGVHRRPRRRRLVSGGGSQLGVGSRWSSAIGVVTAVIGFRDPAPTRRPVDRVRPRRHHDRRRLRGEPAGPPAPRPHHPTRPRGGRHRRARPDRRTRPGWSSRSISTSRVELVPQVGRGDTASATTATSVLISATRPGELLDQAESRRIRVAR